MLSQVMQDALNEQINNEMYSSYSYLAMSAFCEREHFTGCAQWLRRQSQEEYTHAMRLFDFLVARGGRVSLKTINEPAGDYRSVVDVFKEAFDQECEVTGQIDSLYELAFKEKSFSSLVELEWFISEQVEEEKTTREIVHKFNLVKDDPASLWDLDRQLSERSAATNEKE